MRAQRTSDGNDMPGGYGHGDGSFTNRVNDVSWVEKGIRSVAVKGVQCTMCLRDHGTEGLVDEGSFSSSIGITSRLSWDIGR